MGVAVQSVHSDSDMDDEGQSDYFADADEVTHQAAELLVKHHSSDENLQHFMDQNQHLGLSIEQCRGLVVSVADSIKRSRTEQFSWATKDKKKKSGV
eukprot:7636336-Pyramimonas_sp.AAC.1